MLFQEFDAVYPLTKGITQKIFAKSIKGALEAVPVLSEWIDRSKKLDSQWPDWQQSVWLAHTPKDQDALSLTNPARERLAYDEFFAHQLTLAIARLKMRQKKGFSTLGGKEVRKAVISRLNYSLTSSQEQVIAEILSDMAAPIGMYRLLQGDVGSGKTIVAALAVLESVTAGYQAAMMAPTELLAEQHFQTFKNWLSPLGIKVGWCVGKQTVVEKRRVMAELVQGEIDVLVGTHALFQDNVIFSRLGIVVIDEQHRFGVHQRLALRDKGRNANIFPHQLVMTATPIPRTLAMTAYADLDVSVIDELPPGRTAITTAVIPDTRRQNIIERVHIAIEKGDQAYWVCPLVEESDLRIPNMRGIMTARSKPLNKAW